MEEAKKQLEEAIAKSNADAYDKGNLLYLAEEYATKKVEFALKTIAEHELGQ